VQEEKVILISMDMDLNGTL